MTTISTPTNPYPPTEFSKQGRLLFVISGARYYHAGSSRMKGDDYLILHTTKFPLNPGVSLRDEEQTYLKRHRAGFSAIKQDLSKKISGNVISLDSDLKNKENILFFLKSICVPY